MSFKSLLALMLMFTAVFIQFGWAAPTQALIAPPIVLPATAPPPRPSGTVVASQLPCPVNTEQPAACNVPDPRCDPCAPPPCPDPAPTHTMTIYNGGHVEQTKFVWRQGEWHSFTQRRGWR
jgi:hypothetical protein